MGLSVLYLLRVGLGGRTPTKSPLWAIAAEEVSVGGRSAVIEMEVKREREREMERNFFCDSLSCQLEREAPNETRFVPILASEITDTEKNAGEC